MQLAFEINAVGEPLQTQIFQQIHDMIVSGRLKPGARLPSSRSLSEQLGVSRNTVILAYETLIAQGFLEPREGAGTYVSRILPDSSMSVTKKTGRISLIERPIDPVMPVHGLSRSAAIQQTIVYDFALETIDPTFFPRSVWRRLTNWRMQSSRFNLTRYGVPQGLPEFRETLASYLGASRRIMCSPDQIVVVTGAQQALNVAARLFVRAGTTVAIEAPGCSAIPILYRSYGAEILPVPIDQGGITVERLPQSAGAVAVVTPARQFPMAMALSGSRREAILKWAQDTDSHIIEVDFDAEIRYEGSPPPSLTSLDGQGHVVHIGSFAMSIGPGLRVGYMVVPPHLVDEANHAIAVLDYGFPCSGVPWLEQAVLNDFIEGGAFEQHLRKIRRTYMGRRNCLIAALQKHFGSIQINPASCGTHLVWELPPAFAPAPAIQAAVREHQVGVYTLRDNSIADADYLENCDRYLLLGFAALAEEDIEEGVARIAKVLLAA